LPRLKGRRKKLQNVKLKRKSAIAGGFEKPGGAFTMGLCPRGGGGWGGRVVRIAAQERWSLKKKGSNYRLEGEVWNEAGKSPTQGLVEWSLAKMTAVPKE